MSSPKRTSSAPVRGSSAQLASGAATKRLGETATPHSYLVCVRQVQLQSERCGEVSLLSCTRRCSSRSCPGCEMSVLREYRQSPRESKPLVPHRWMVLVNLECVRLSGSADGLSSI